MLKPAHSLLLVLLLLPVVVAAQDYVGDATCGQCHANMPEEGFFNAYQQSGHPYKLVKVENGEAPVWPHTDAPPLPEVNGEQLTWDDVTYVIGNFFWKARFIGNDGYIVTGGEDDVTQWNLATEEWVPYHAGEQHAYDCGRCHTTGYDAEGHQDDLEGITGTWTQPGIRCEACHGPGGDHVSNPGNVEPPGGKTCAECHYRDAEFRMPWKGGFTRHHQQAEDFSHSPHAEHLTCTTCHDPHKSTLYELGGLKDAATCTNCHNDDNYLVDNMEQVACIDCHMPFMGKSAVAFNEHKGDVRGHLFRINDEPIMATANLDTIDGVIYWHQEENGEAKATLDYACMGCHTDGDIDDLAEYAEDIHENHPSSVKDGAALPLTTNLSKAYPNPFNSEARIDYSLSRTGEMNLRVLDMSGRTVAVLASGNRPAGAYSATFSAGDLPSGAYFVQLTFGGLQLNQKVVLLR